MDCEDDIQETVMDSFAKIADEFSGQPGPISKAIKSLKNTEFERYDLKFGSMNLGQNSTFIAKHSQIKENMYIGGQRTNILYNRETRKMVSELPKSLDLFRVVPYKEYLIDLSLTGVTIYDLQGNIVARLKGPAIVEYFKYDLVLRSDARFLEITCTST